MPMPRWWGHVTKRVFNPRAIAGGKYPVLIHVGRTSGKTRHTPLDAHPVDGGYLFVPVYGPEADWVRNIMTAGKARLRIDGREVDLIGPRLVGADEFPDGVTRPPKLLRVTEFLRMDVKLRDDPARDLVPEREADRPSS